MQLKTERLRIFPLSYEQFDKYLKTNHLLEKELGLVEFPRFLSEETVENIRQNILPTVRKTEDPDWFRTIWLIVLKSENTMIGYIGFRADPNEEGEIEIAYGSFENFRKKGYMTEAVAAVLDWAFGQKGVKKVIAETDFDNDASHTVLKRNGFEIFLQLENMSWWHLER